MMIRFEPFRALSPDYRVGGLVSAMDSGRDTPGDGFSARLSGNARPIQSGSDARSTLSGGQIEGRAVQLIFEGLTRLCCLLSRIKKGIVTPSPIHVYVGVTSELDRWSFCSV